MGGGQKKASRYKGNLNTSIYNGFQRKRGRVNEKKGKEGAKREERKIIFNKYKKSTESP